MGQVRALTKHQELLLADYPAPHLFAVVSWGCAGTGWVTRTLNSHPDIFAVHAANSIWNMLGSGSRLAGVEYMRIIGVLGTGHIAAGDVHGVTAHEVACLRRVYGGHFSSAVVVREPMARLKSLLALNAHFADAFEQDFTFLDPYLREIGLEPSQVRYADRQLVHSINALNNIIVEQTAGPVFRMEDITSDPEVLRDFIQTIALVSIELGWAQAAVLRGPTNMHAPTTLTMDNRTLELIAQLVKPEARRAYSALGYPPVP